MPHAPVGVGLKAGLVIRAGAESRARGAGGADLKAELVIRAGAERRARPAPRGAGAGWSGLRLRFLVRIEN